MTIMKRKKFFYIIICENQPGDGARDWLAVTFERMLEALGILHDTQAAEPKQAPFASGEARAY